MTRSLGFARGDIDTSFPLDDKFLALRASTDSGAYYAASGVYFHIVAATWREAERKSAARVAPDATDSIAHLVRVGLLDVEECVPKRAFTHSVGRATRARRTSTARKSRNRAEMSRGTDRDSPSRHAVSTDIQSGAERSGTERDSTERVFREREGLPHIDAETIRVLEGLTGRSAANAGDRQLTELDRLLEDHPAAKVRDALTTVARGKRVTARQAVWDAVKLLEPFTDPKDIKPADDSADRFDRGVAATQREQARLRGESA